MKSFIETQRALLAEIQNGCKRNFILAKEKEENEQKMRLSASMAEIATEDGTGEEVEEEEEPASQDRDHEESKQGEEEAEAETTESGGQTSGNSGVTSEMSIAQLNLESDSDTEEEEEEVVTQSSSASSSSTRTNQTAPQPETGVAPPVLSVPRTSLSPSASPAAGPSVISSITVTESAAPPGTPPSPGRCISVSSPGRGHKIFMVTRVESPPEKQLLQIRAPATATQTKENSEKPVCMTSQPRGLQPQPPPASQTLTQTQLTLNEVEQRSPAPSTDCKLTESVLHTTQIHTLEPESICQPTEDKTASTLDQKVTDPSPQALDPPKVQIVVSQPTEDAAKSTENHSECRVEEETGQEQKGISDERQLMSPHILEELDKSCPNQPCTVAVLPAVAQQHPLPSAVEQLQNEHASASELALSQNQKEEKEREVLPKQEKEEQTENRSLTEEENNQPNQEEPSPHPQTAAGERGVEPVLSVHTDQQAPSDSPKTASTGPETIPEANPDSAVGEEESADESSADDDECFSEALEGEVVSSALPNGLKQEFSLHLRDAENPKPGSCVMEHGESHQSLLL